MNAGDVLTAVLSWLKSHNLLMHRTGCHKKEFNLLDCLLSKLSDHLTLIPASRTAIKTRNHANASVKSCEKHSQDRQKAAA
jgi:hypothetical protein